MSERESSQPSASNETKAVDDVVAYEKPRVEVLGDLRQLTEGGDDDDAPDTQIFGGAASGG